MTEGTSSPGNTGPGTGSEPDAPGEDQEAAMMRAVMRAQERHREGGVDPELDEPDAQPGSGG